MSCAALCVYAVLPTSSFSIVDNSSPTLYYFDFSMYLYWLIYFVPSFLPLLVAVVVCRRARAKANLISGSSSSSSSSSFHIFSLPFLF